MSKFYSYDYPPLASERIDKALSEFPEMLHDIKPNIRKKFRIGTENMHIVNAFIEVADLLRVEGKREYYSARAIFETFGGIHFLRTRTRISRSQTMFVHHL